MFAKTSIKSKMAILVAAFSLAMIAQIIESWSTITSVSVNGPRYQHIVMTKDLIADILPPPEYVIESYLGVLEMKDETDPTRLRALTEEAARLRKDYEDRHRFWQSQNLTPEVKRAFLEDSYIPAIRFFDLRDGKLIPAVLAG